MREGIVAQRSGLTPADRARVQQMYVAIDNEDYAGSSEPYVVRVYNPGGYAVLTVGWAATEREAGKMAEGAGRILAAAARKPSERDVPNLW